MCSSSDLLTKLIKLLQDKIPWLREHAAFPIGGLLNAEPPEYEVSFLGLRPYPETCSGRLMIRGMIQDANTPRLEMLDNICATLTFQAY